MGVEQKVIDSYDARVRDDQRRFRSLERRYVPQSASDLLGPGFAPTSVQILDWNADETRFNGQFYSPIGAINSPDPGLEWVGFSLVQNDTWAGVQKAWSAHKFNPALQQSRRWYSLDGGATRLFTPWRGDTVWTDVAVLAPLAVPGTSENPQIRVIGGMVKFHGIVQSGPSNFGASTTPTIVEIGAYPDYCRPEFKVNTILASNNTQMVRGVAYVDGHVEIWTPASLVGGNYADLSNLSWPLALNPI